MTEAHYDEEMRREAAIRRVARKRAAAAERALGKIAHVMGQKYTRHLDGIGAWDGDDWTVHNILQNFYDTFGGFDEDQ